MSNHAEKGIRVIDEFFKTDAEMSEEAKLWEGLTLAVNRNWLSAQEAEDCMAAFIEARHPDEAA